MSDSRLIDHPLTHLSSSSDALRRMLDIVVSFVALLILSPIMFLIAVAIILDGGRPIFFKQVRLGKNGKPFNMYKFRKFHRECGTAGSPLTLKEDPRMTNIGWFLASTKLDELPQLWNTLRGDMSIVGPRPESLPFADCFSGTFRQVLDHKPGILGPSQVAFRNESLLYPTDTDPTEFYRRVMFPAKASLDLEYYSRRNLTQDALWIVRGVLAVLGYNSAYRASELLSDYSSKAASRAAVVVVAAKMTSTRNNRP